MKSLWFMICLMVHGGGVREGWIPHVPPTDAAYVMRLTIVSDLGERGNVSWMPFRQDGSRMSAFVSTLEISETRVIEATELFEPGTSHVLLDKSGCSVFWSYQIKEHSDGQALFELVDGTYEAEVDWQHGVDGAFGLALVNTVDMPISVGFEVIDGSKVVGKRALDLNPFEKVLLDHSRFSEFEEVVLRWRSDHPVAVVSAQRSWSGQASSFFPRQLRAVRSFPESEIVVAPDPGLRQLLDQVADTDPRDGWITQIEMQRLLSLDCSGRGIHSLAGMESATQLRVLLCANNQIVDLSPISGLEALNVLDISSNPIDEIPELNALPNLTNLRADGLRLKEIPPSWLKRQLLVLSLKYNRLQQAFLEEVPQLHSLNLASNDLLDEHRVTLPQSLVSLDLGRCGFTKFDYDLPNLEDLELWDNCLTSDQCEGILELISAGVEVSYERQCGQDFNCPMKRLTGGGGL